MKTIYKLRKKISILVILTMLITLLPNKVNVQAEETETSQSTSMIQDVSTSDTSELSADVFVEQPGAENTWRVTGNCNELGNWDNSSANGLMTHLVGAFYVKSLILNPGKYEFKFTKNGSWDNSIANNAGNNFSFELTETTKVNIYLNDELEGLNKVRISLSSLESQGLRQYDPASSTYQGPKVDKWPRLVGDLQVAMGETDNWSPGTATAMFVDYYFDGSVFKLQRTLPKGTYQSKVVYGNTWDNTNYGDGNNNHVIKVLSTSNIIFTTVYETDNSKGVLIDNYKPADSLYDGKIDTDALYFDSRDITYKKPFGAIKNDTEDVTFRFAAKAGDAQYVKLELIDANSLSQTFDMKVKSIVDNKDYWECTVDKSAFNSIGIWNYKFIVLDGQTKVEYGDDSLSGGIGAYSTDGQTPYNITVYDKDFTTPDWIKDAVVYQIFPDRFYDGDSSNNRAKVVDGCRSDKLQFFDGGVLNDPTPEQVFGDWDTLPENPRQAEDKVTYPDAVTDGVWTNEFYGGDIEGIQKKITYLKNLGVTAIYLNPVSWAASNHKYDATDYAHLDPMFGEPVYNIAGDPTSGLDYDATRTKSDKVYSDFADACKDAGIHLIVDGVFNHVGDDSIYFDRYSKYPEIGAYEYWSQVWDEVGKQIPLTYDENTSVFKGKEAYIEAFTKAKEEAIANVKNKYLNTVNPADGAKYELSDFEYINWFQVGPKKDSNGIYEYDRWWGYDSLPEILEVNEANTNLSNDSSATISGTHEYNNVNFRETVLGYDLNQESADKVSDLLKNTISQRWLYLGSSGWRLDCAPDVSNDTWKMFRTAVKSAAGKTNVNGDIIDEPVIIGEEWNVATKYLLGDQFDSVMNYQFRAAVQNYIQSKDALAFHNALEVIRENYPKEAWEAMINLVDSHDTVRNITKIDQPTWEEENTKNASEASEKAIKLQALTAIIQLSYPGAPTIYYGDEVGLVGTKDPDSRRSFPWERIDKTDNSIADEYADKYGDLYNTYIKAADVRNDNLDLFAAGDMKVACTDNGVIAYARKTADNKKVGLSVVNITDQEQTITANVADFIVDGTVLTDQLSNDGVSVTVANGTALIKVPAYAGMMMVNTNSIGEIPKAPSNVIAVASEGNTPSVELNWDKVDGIDGYIVYRTELEGTKYVKITDTITSNNYVDYNVLNGNQYYYYIKSVQNKVTSQFSAVATALPKYVVGEISKPTSSNPVSLKVGNRTDDIYVDISIPGLTSNDQYVGKDVKDASILLEYYVNDDVTNAQPVVLNYQNDLDDNHNVVTGGSISYKRYAASFEPREEGTYTYYAKVSLDHGLTYIMSEKTTVDVTRVESSETPKLSDLSEITQESSRATLNWTVDDSSIVGFEIYRTVDGTLERKMIYQGVSSDFATKVPNQFSYTDYTVNNNVNYSYEVVAYNQYYQKSVSNSEMVTPKLVMVEVTMRLHTDLAMTPTTETDSIYISGDMINWPSSGGWEFKKPSGAVDRNVVEYTFKMLAGKSINYKYTRGSWDSEGFTTRDINNTQEIGYYCFSNEQSNLQLTVVNQGNNKMVMDEYLIRWKDMPLVLTSPVKSYLSTENAAGTGYESKVDYTTTESTFDIKANVPYGVEVTINGDKIKDSQMDERGNVSISDIPLKDGENVFIIHCEPTVTTLDNIFGGSDRKKQATATTTLTVTKTTGSETESPKPSTTPVPSVTPEPTVTPIPSVKPTPSIKPTPSNTPAPNVTPEPTNYPTPTVAPTSVPSPAETKTPATQTPKPTTEPTNATEPKVVPNKAWSNVISMIKNAKVGTIIKVDISNSTELPVLVQKSMIGKKVTLELYGENYFYRIKGSNIEKNVKFKNINLRVNKIVDANISKILKNLKLADKLVSELEVLQKTTFGYQVELSWKVDKKYINKKVYISRYNESTKKLDAVANKKVSKKGYITLILEKGGKYVIALTNPVQKATVKQIGRTFLVGRIISEK